jgi:hypothetical protein
MLWQLDGRFHRDQTRLAAALERLPAGRHAFELRHDSWFVDDVYELLRTHRVALVVADRAPAGPTPWVPTCDWAYIRFHSGRGRNGVYTRSQISEWAGASPLSAGMSTRISTTTGRPSRSRTPSSFGTLSSRPRRSSVAVGAQRFAPTNADTQPAMSSHVGAPPPYASYAAILATFGGLLAATAALERARHEQRSVTALELTLLAAASFKAARAISRERVGSVVREPFVEGERPAGSGTRRAFGELVTCTRCVGTWAGGRPHCDGDRRASDSVGYSR